MRISCVLNAQEVGETPADLIVFPEGVCNEEIQKTCIANPDSIIVGTEVYGGYCRGLLMHRHHNKINYLKIKSDKRTSKGSEDLLRSPLLQSPVYEMSNICIGVLICMDVDYVDFASTVINQIKSSNCELKLLCVPADMGSEWFSMDTLLPAHQGVHVVLCNHTKTYQFPSRCQSFVTDMFGKKIAVQNQHEPVCVQL